ncbi:MAG: hypothetical protein H6718_22670 [Polyangiaceae bacterium]|nr:hypothetical protein [Polyangiaceae bacterium]MCB9610572.1 hypothetical protein [Polyangiaceae bacterium]
MSRGNEAAAQDPVKELKLRAKFLHRAVMRSDPAAVKRLRALPELRRADDAAIVAQGGELRRKHCLAVVARECGFPSWEHALRALSGDVEISEHGTLLYSSSGVLNHWFSSYDEAHAAWADARRDGVAYLFAYKRDYFVTGVAFVESLGLDPDDPDWQALGWNWVKPANVEARARLFYKRLLAIRAVAAA